MVTILVTLLVIVGCILIFLILFIWCKMRKKRKQAAEPVPDINPYTMVSKKKILLPETNSVLNNLFLFQYLISNVGHQNHAKFVAVIF